MSFLITSYDRTSMCNHEGVLGRTLEDGTRTCLRCGTVIRPQAESFTKPIGRKSDRPAKRIAPR